MNLFLAKIQNRHLLVIFRLIFADSCYEKCHSCYFSFYYPSSQYQHPFYIEKKSGPPRCFILFGPFFQLFALTGNKYRGNNVHKQRSNNKLLSSADNNSNLVHYKSNVVCITINYTVPLLHHFL